MQVGTSSCVVAGVWFWLFIIILYLLVVPVIIAAEESVSEADHTIQETSTRKNNITVIMDRDLLSSSAVSPSSGIASLKKRLLTNDNDDYDDNRNSREGTNYNNNNNDTSGNGDDDEMQTPSAKRTCCTASSCSSTNFETQLLQQQKEQKRLCITPSPTSTTSSSTTTTTTTSSSSNAAGTKRRTGINLPPPTKLKTNAANAAAATTNIVIIKTPKRNDYLNWDEYFLAVAILSSKRSKDPISPSGACIVDKQNRVVGIGYSGFPKGCSDDIFPWTSSSVVASSSASSSSSNKCGTEWLHTKYPYICHAVPNAILNKSSNDVVGCRIYVTTFPTSDCTKMIIQSGIKEVVILGGKNNNDEDEVVLPSTSSTNDSFLRNNNVNDDDEDKQASRILLEMAGVKLRYYQPPFNQIILDFLPSLTPVAAATTNTAADIKKESGDPRNRNNEVEAATSEQEEVAIKDSSANIDDVDNDKEAKRLLWEEAGYDHEKQHVNNKRKDYLSWQDYFMSMAFLTAQRSKDPNTQVGAAIVSKNNRLIGLGYNGFPTGCSDDSLPWARSNTNKLHNKYVYVCHAEVNAILNKGSSNVEGAIIYVALFPCENCAKMIIQSGIKEVVFMSDSYHDTPGCRASRIMFGAAGVKLTQYIPSMQRLTVEF